MVIMVHMFPNSFRLFLQIHLMIILFIDENDTVVHNAEGGSHTFFYICSPAKTGSDRRSDI